MKRFLRAISIGLITYGAVVCLLAMMQRSLIYFPTRQDEQVMLARANQEDVEPWRDSSGEIIGWRSHGPTGAPAKNRLLVFHGNAGHALHRTHFIKDFGAIDQGQTWEVYVFEYPGYGARHGSLGETSFTQAGLAALDELDRVDSRPIFLVGESLGSGLACKLAQLRPEKIAGLFLITPFTSLRDAAHYHYPWLPVRFILLDRWDNLTALHNYHGRIGVMVAGQDEVIPARQGLHLFEAAGNPKRLWMQDSATHNGLDFSRNAPWRREVSDFLLSRSD